MQEYKTPVCDAFDTVDASLEITAGALSTAQFDGPRMRAALAHGFVNATELADYLVTKGVAFRQAHHVAGRLVHYALEQGKTLDELTLPELHKEHAAFDQDVYKALDPETAVERRNVVGGPARAQVQAQIDGLRARLSSRGLDVDGMAQAAGAQP